jgi:hypothetical protein
MGAAVCAWPWHFFCRIGRSPPQKHHQAWQLIDTARGKGGRLDALQELHEDRVPLVGVDVSGFSCRAAPGTSGFAPRLHAADVRNAVVPAINFSDANLRSANFATAIVAARPFEVQAWTMPISQARI